MGGCLDGIPVVRLQCSPRQLRTGLPFIMRLVSSPEPDSRRSFLLLAPVVMASLLLVGCGGGDEVADMEEPAGNIHEVADADVPEIEIGDLEPEPVPAFPEVGQEAPKPVAVMPGDDADESEEDVQQDYNSMLNAANDALESFFDNNGRFPKSMTELLNEGELTMAPRVPAGKRLIFDRTTRRFAYVDK